MIRSIRFQPSQLSNGLCVGESSEVLSQVEDDFFYVFPSTPTDQLVRGDYGHQGIQPLSVQCLFPMLPPGASPIGPGCNARPRRFQWLITSKLPLCKSDEADGVEWFFAGI